ncbi:hypothetical protein J437_LFUL014186 [Ladona fulva]|uniref:Cortactin-binding protein-2 N-terminal domain-containing protein n=1 Tax=Ladona fulva TaxID=123851 RepID=A0A8K0P3F4_LADFU|nr:hypothetical protein J437_LFUL014186 [Ladona fulva]
MASNRIQTQGTPTKSPQHIHQQQSGFEQLDKSTSNTLKSEKVKQLLNLGGYRPASINDPLAALQRDSFAANEPRVDEMQIRAIADHQMSSLDNLILQHRKTQLRMSRVLKEAEERHKKVVQELDEEKRKHEHDTAQGDDITYGLEKERTRLKQFDYLLEMNFLMKNS